MDFGTLNHVVTAALEAGHAVTFTFTITPGRPVLPPRLTLLPSDPVPSAVSTDPLKLKEAAAHFGVSERSLKRAQREGHLHCLLKKTGKDSGAWTVTREEMNRYLGAVSTSGAGRAA